MQEFFGGSFPGGIDLDEIGKHATIFERGQQLLGGFGGVGVVREDIFERLALGTETGAFSAKAVDLSSQLERTRSGVRRVLLRRLCDL